MHPHMGVNLNLKRVVVIKNDKTSYCTQFIYPAHKIFISGAYAGFVCYRFDREILGW